MNETTEVGLLYNNNNVKNYLKFIFFSAFGVILFFTPVTINGTSSIPLDHLITYLKAIQPNIGRFPILEIFVNEFSRN